MPILVLFCLLLGLPLLEIYVLISVGQAIGAWQTVLLVVVTAVAGTWLLRWQGMATLARLRNALNEGRVPAQELLEGAVLLVTSVLLLTPGFVTDAVGLLCLLPSVRQALARQIAARLFMRAGGSSSADRTLEGQFRVDSE